MSEDPSFRVDVCSIMLFARKLMIRLRSVIG